MHSSIVQDRTNLFSRLLPLYFSGALYVGLGGFGVVVAEDSAGQGILYLVVAVADPLSSPISILPMSMVVFPQGDGVKP